MRNVQHVRSKPESYFIVTVGLLGALTWAYGASNADSEIMNRGIDLMATGITFFMTENKKCRTASLIGAAGSLFAPSTSVPNIISGLSGATAGYLYLQNLLNDHEPTRLSF